MCHVKIRLPAFEGPFGGFQNLRNLCDKISFSDFSAFFSENFSRHLCPYAAFVPTYQPVKRLIFGTTRFYNRGTIGDDFAEMRQIRRRNGEGRWNPLDMSNGFHRPLPFPLWILRICAKSSPIVPRGTIGDDFAQMRQIRRRNGFF